MMDKIKNSILSKCLQVLLMGYFLLSSINSTNSFKSSVSDNADVYKTGSTLGFILKKIFKCSGCTEEYDDYETKTDANKSIIDLDYLLPGCNWLLAHTNFTKIKSRLYVAESALTCSFYFKIHLPPPENA
jgi:hypothetical protein